MSESAATLVGPIESETLKAKLVELILLDPEPQQQALDALQLRDPAMASELRSLLGYAAAVTLPGLHAPERLLGELQQSQLPTQFGVWQVLGELGRGGMGVVLRGKRADGAFDKEVAIKVLPPLMATGEAGERFLQEARLLAPLDHPNIARLIDAGMAQGCAYFVMDLVEGLAVNRAARPLPLKDRLKLVLQLCGALSFAHGRLLIHRDIKPANVLVDQRGQVRLLDFGIAKLMGENEVTRTLQSQAFTPSYASPEQMQGQAIGVTSDVFSLGVLLYEICTNAHPFLSAGDINGSNTLATMAAMLDRPPATAPMQRAALATDLQAVLLKTLEKTPERRYGSIDALAADLEAYLAGLPVKAQAPTWRYQATKFVRRHAGAVSMAAVTTFTILGLGAWSIYSAKMAREQSALAQKRLDSVREIANKVVFDYNNALEPIAGTLAVRKTIVSDALTYLEAQVKEAQGDLSLKSDIARGFEAVGDVQGRGVTASNLGDLEGARTSYLKAFALREAVCAVEPLRRVAGNTSTNASANLPACSAQAATHMLLGDNLFALGKAPEAIAQMSQARAVNSPMLLSKALDPKALVSAQQVQFNALHRLGGLSTRQTGDAFAQGLAIAKENLPLAVELAKNDNSPAAVQRLRDANDFLANRLMAAGQAQAALAPMQEAVALSRKLYATQPSGSNAVFVASSLVGLAEIKQHLLQANPAERDALEALELMRTVHLADPANAFLKARYANIGRRAASVLNMAGDKLSHATAARLMAQAAQVSGSFTPKDGVFYVQHQQVVFEWAKAAFALGDAPQAQKLLQLFPNEGEANPRAAQDLADVYLLKAKVAERSADLAAAQSLLDLALKPLRATASQTPANMASRAMLGQACTWAAQSKLASKSDYKRCAREQREALQTANGLTAWWAAQIKNSSNS